jgi:hypothetical protein
MLTRETIEEYIADGNAALLPGMAARDVANRIMGTNQGEKGDGWLCMEIEEVLIHAYNHIWTASRIDPMLDGEDHLAHALTRIAMAITLRERQKDVQPTL